jgi:hypothetical protein
MQIGRNAYSGESMKLVTLLSPADTRANWRIILQWVSIVVAGEIALHSLFVKEPVLTMAGAALWLGGCLWTRRGGAGGPVLIAILATWEILATLFLSEEFVEGAAIPDWILAVHLVSVVIALLASVMAIRGHNAPRTRGLSVYNGFTGKP